MFSQINKKNYLKSFASSKKRKEKGEKSSRSTHKTKMSDFFS